MKIIINLFFIIFLFGQNKHEENFKNIQLKKIKTSKIYQIDDKIFKKIMDKGPQHLLSQVIPVPVVKDKRFVGYKLTVFFPDYPEIKEGVIKRGDIITRINGLSIEKPEQYLYAFKVCKKSPQIKIEFIRNGQHKTVAFKIVSQKTQLPKIKIKKLKTEK